MQEQDYKELIQVIDSRINTDNGYYSGKVTQVSENNKKAYVKLVGGEEEFELLNKTGEILSINDSVYVHSLSKTLSGGYIAVRFGEANIAENENVGGSYLPRVCNIKTLTTSTKAYVKWEDPSDPYKIWKGTLLVKKVGSYPIAHTDGIVVVNNTIHNQYKDKYFEETDLSNGTEYFYRFFPYSIDDMYFANCGDSFTLIANPLPTGDITNVQVQETKNNSISFTWDDPELNIIEDGITLSTWGGTKVVYNTNHYPETIEDGTMVAETLVIDSNIETPLEINGLVNGTKYYFGLFPLSTLGVVNNNTREAFVATPNPVLSMTIEPENASAFQVYSANTGTNLSATDVAIIRNNIQQEPNKVYMTYIEDGLAYVQSNSLPYNKLSTWKPELNLGNAQDIAIEVDGSWHLSLNTGMWELVTEDNPWIFKVENNNLTWWNWEVSTRLDETIPNVLKVSAIRGWKANNATNSDDMGLIMAYIKSDNKVYYRSYCVQNDGLSAWEQERMLDYDGFADTVTLFRTNDFRVGFCIGYQGNITNVYTQRVLSGMSTPVEILQMPTLKENNVSMFVIEQETILAPIETLTMPELNFVNIAIGTDTEFNMPLTYVATRLNDYEFYVDFIFSIEVLLTDKIPEEIETYSIVGNRLNVALKEPMGTYYTFTIPKNMIFYTINDNLKRFADSFEIELNKPIITLEVSLLPETLEMPSLAESVSRMIIVEEHNSQVTETLMLPIATEIIINQYVVGSVPV